MGIENKHMKGKQAAAYKAGGMFSFFNWFSRSKSIGGETIAPFKNPLSGKRMRYLIGADAKTILRSFAYDQITVLPYDWDGAYLPPTPVGYCNLYWQKGAPDCAPYLDDTDTSEEYGERVIDPYGSGFVKNLRWQFERWQKLGVRYVELDNPDGYDFDIVLNSIVLAERHGFGVIAKNPGLLKGHGAKYVAQCHGIISEKGAGSPAELDQIRRDAGFPDMPVWFVAYGVFGNQWVRQLYVLTTNFKNMGVTLSPDDEYTEAEDVVVPHVA